MSESHKENAAQNIERARQHRLRNAEKFAAYQKEYREANKEKHAAYKTEWRAKNAERLAEADRQRHANNREERCRRERERYAAKAPEIKLRFKTYQAANRAAENARSRAKKARKINATPAWADMAAIKAVYAEAVQHGHHVDHIIPLRSKLVCGLHVHENLRPLDPGDNMRKHNRFDPDEHVWQDGEWHYCPKI